MTIEQRAKELSDELHLKFPRGCSVGFSGSQIVVYVHQRGLSKKVRKLVGATISVLFVGPISALNGILHRHNGGKPPKPTLISRNEP